VLFAGGGDLAAQEIEGPGNRAVTAEADDVVGLQQFSIRPEFGEPIQRRQVAAQPGRVPACIDLGLVSPGAANVDRREIGRGRGRSGTEI